MGVFFIETTSGHVATKRQLVDAGLTGRDGTPPAPWHQIRGPNDASTMWYAVLRRQTRGVFIGAIAFRHGARYPSLLAAGWQEVAIEDIGGSLPAKPSSSGASDPR